MGQQNTSNDMNTNNTVPDYGEPWSPSFRVQGIAIDRKGARVTNNVQKMTRAIACVNLLAGHDPEKVEVVPKEVMAAYREAIKEAREAFSKLANAGHLGYCNLLRFANAACDCGLDDACAALTKLNALKP